ncbi:glycosyltransferase family 4 protein [Salinicoccus cyprini]|uniref:Glycosyltransferase family 4 protein n=1 Tax=Salinicoccus cyprini TaxID=2493691 RepID=A0A558AXB0_9STAP|nr:glycosyltransferase family 4 protein [Salinicoccus cyprini]TVT28889.1 glycosyltransferase family 4 protein [Salinicoccus cyprini]
MKLLYIVFFNAPMGGLHENVYASALYMKKHGCEVHVVSKPGLLQERLESHGINTIPTDFSSVEETLESIENTSVNFDLIHFHPGRSKHAALKYGRKYEIPMVETYHGMWADELRKHIRHLSAVITVSEGVKGYLQNSISKYHERYYVMPNGYDTERFNQPIFHTNDSSELNIGLITRLDQDKQFIMDIMLLAVNHLRKNTRFKLNIHIIGDGTLKDEFVELCTSLLKNSNHEIIFKGWLVDKALEKAYLDCDIIIAPGRSAIEGMACGKPVISVGSKNYVGLIKNDNWQKGVHNNFGGAGQRFLNYEIGHVENDLDHLLEAPERIRTLGEFSRKIALQFFDADKINQELFDLYKIILKAEEVKKTLGYD